MGSNTPEIIINTNWFYSTIHFVTCRGTPKYVLGDINLIVDWEGQELLEFMEHQAKTKNCWKYIIVL